MSDQVEKLVPGENLPVEPVGLLKERGWMPGTWVQYSEQEPSIHGVLGTVEISNGEGVIAGFLLRGPQHKEFMSDLNQMYKNHPREGGDNFADISSFDIGGENRYDNQGLIQRHGTRVAVLQITPTGSCKFHVFETKDKLERDNPGTGSLLEYKPNIPLYVSENGLLTSEKESANSVWTGYLVARFIEDKFNGDSIVVTAGMM